MQYPLMSEYVSAIRDASENLDKLAHLVPVLDDHGEPYRSSGAFAVVFKMKDEQTGKCYALKCFTEEQEGKAEAYRQIADELEFVDSSYITSVKYLDKEIFVDSSCEEDEFPVLLMDWIDGETMENYIAENYQDNYAMSMLCYRFCKMAAWLCSQSISHVIALLSLWQNGGLAPFTIFCPWRRQARQYHNPSRWLSYIGGL